MSRRAWIDSWNDIIRDVIFADKQLKQLMMLSPDVGIIQFIDRYFVRASYTNKILKDQPVRIVYGDVASSDGGTPYVTRNVMSFDIYVKQQHMRDAQPDRLVMRTQLIALRLVRLLLKHRYINDGYRFWVLGQRDMGTSTIGYSRYNITFAYLKTY